MARHLANDRAHMIMGIASSAAAKIGKWMRIETVGGGIQCLLAGEGDANPQSPPRQRIGERCKLDGFRTRSDDEPDRVSMQPSP